MTIYFTSDSHFNHKNILDFTDRPYDTVEEMNEGMIEQWNNQVNNDDYIYHLGDLSLGSMENAENVLKRLKGNIILIKGNHDHSKHYKKLRHLLYDYHEVGITLKYNKQQMWLTHYPMEIGLRPRKFSISGHIHSENNSYYNQINVGVDSPTFKHKPFGELITMDELYEEMERRLPYIEEVFLENKRKQMEE